MLPGPDLAWHAGAARQRGLDTLSDDELIGLLGAARRLASWSAGLELAAWPSWTPAGPGRAAARASTWPRNSPSR
jgi:hypothetical protein